MSFAIEIEKSSPTETDSDNQDVWKSRQRRASINLLDMTDVLSAQPNSYNQLEQQHSRDDFLTADKNKEKHVEIETLLLDNKKDADNYSLLLKQQQQQQQQQNKAKLLYTSLQKFDPLQQLEKEKTVEQPLVQQSASKIIPTRLPTPRRPILQNHLSADLIQVADHHPTTNIIQLDPTPPSSPGRRVRQTSIARFVKIPPKESLGKANRELAEFDPLISPTTTTAATVTKRISSISMNKSDNTSTIKNHKGLLTSSSCSNTTTIEKGGVQNSFESTNNLMKQEKTGISSSSNSSSSSSTTPPKQCVNNNSNYNLPTTRIPLPVISIPPQQPRNRSNNKSHHSNKIEQEITTDEVKDETPQESSISRFDNNKGDQLLLPATASVTTTNTTTTPATAVHTTTATASKLRKPEVIVPKSIKRLPSQPGSTTKKEISVNYSRRPSYPTAANEILQDQWDKEREKSRRLSANLIFAQGVISQPDDIINENESSFIPPLLSRTVSHESRMEKIHDRLQCLVDVGIPENSNNDESNNQAVDEPIITDHKREQGITGVMSPKTALNRYRPYLSPFEKTEIMRYPSVYCVGSHAKKNWPSTDETALNYGYDDEKGDYQIVIKDHLNYRYEIVELLGKGSFGQVVKCRDHKPAVAPSLTTKDEPASSNLVAVKIIRNKKRFHAQAQTEVKILEQLMAWDPKNKHYNVRMLNSFYFRDHLCIVFECLSLNLYEILQQNSYQGFSMGLVKRFGYQILTSLKLLSEHNVIHCDLKPENILLRQPDRSGIRVIDYGSSCFVNQKVYTYIQSRFYRAPEVILGMDYGLAIDMWSTGCILAELYTGRPLFPGENEQDQLACIMQLIGVPDKQYLESCSRKKQFFDTYDQPRKSINSKGKKRRPNTMTFTEALKRSTYDNFDKDFGDFISRCLIWEPEKRMKPIEALNHPWVQAMKK